MHLFISGDEWEVNKLKDKNKTKTELIKELIAFRKEREKGTINDITEKKQAERREKQLTTEMNFLYKTAFDFIQLGPKDDIYRFIGRKLKEIVEDSIVLINSYDKTSDSLQVRALEGFREKIKIALKIVGKDLFTMIFPITNEEARNALISGELTKVAGGLYGLSFGQIPKSTCYVLEKFLNLGKMYTSGFVKGGALFGNILIILPKNVELNNREFINTFIKQSAIMLQSKQAEENVKNAKDELQIILDSVPAIIFYKDIEGKIIRANKTLADSLEMSAKDIIGKTTEELFSKEQAENMRKDDKEVVISGKQKRNIIESYTSPDGIRWLITEKIPYRNKKDEVTGVVSLSKDITKQRQIEEKVQDMLKEIKKDRKNLKKLSKKLIKAQEEERRKISEIIHDDIGQNITAIKINMSLFEEAINTNNVSKVKERLTETKSLLNHIFDKLYEFGLDLLSPILRDIGLVPALCAYVDRYKKREKINIDFKVINLKKRLNKEIEIVIFRIVQEAFTNISKHACASNIYLSLENKKSKVCVLIKDNGKGFNIKNISDFEELSKGLGLIEMRERIEIVGGSLEIKSSLGEGTQLLIEIPCYPLQGNLFSFGK